eukprot:CAMPEP_0113695538 /NCGR_PEP_ID=MMETSP0038_2-20120614/20964_1 /TAXON_ID=2898 /ORGANISM="Cryptomonas paramecium" /LENGTH=162 /DNA_ID=CAMNT_0000618109 /DNA_START=95 /DNA_END=580 /DNA_ORIENTATION=+ /assembly_acc=CAM_ASM_000170
MPIFIRVAEAGALHSEISKGGWSSKVIVSPCGTGMPQTTSIQAGNMPLWNEVLEIDDSTSLDFNVTLLVYKGNADALDENYIDRSYSVDLSIPDDNGDSYCDEWIEIPSRSSTQPEHRRTDPEMTGLRETVRLRLTCSFSLEVVSKVQQGLCPFQCSAHGQW